MKWIKRKWAVAKQNPLFWANFMLAGIVCAAWRLGGPIHNSADLHLRMLGAALELVGVGTVWYDLSRSAAKVGKDGILNRTMKWLGVLVLNRPVIASASASISSSIASAMRATQRRPLNAMASVEERLENLEKNQSYIDQDLDASWKKIDTVSQDLRRGLATEREERDKQVQEILGSLADVAAGSYALLLFGVVWLSVGLLISGFSHELVQLQQWWGF